MRNENRLLNFVLMVATALFLLGVFSVVQGCGQYHTDDLEPVNDNIKCIEFLYQEDDDVICGRTAVC